MNAVRRAAATALAVISLVAVLSHVSTAQVRKLADPLLGRAAWPSSSLLALGAVKAGGSADEAAANILAFYATEETGRLDLRVSMVRMVDPRDGRDHFAAQGVRVLVLVDDAPGGRTDLPLGLAGVSPIAWESYVELGGAPAAPLAARHDARGAALERLDATLARVDADRDVLAASFALPGSLRGRVGAASTGREPGAQPVRFHVISVAGGAVRDRLVVPAAPRVYEASCAFAHHGNQGLSYSDVFHGRSGAEASSGFDEILSLHQNTAVPGNFHLAPLLQTSQLWDHNTGDALDMNAWLATGVTQGWAGILTSAYGQHIMPFVTNGMNDWSIDREKAMNQLRYGYNSRVAWIPERVWLSPTSGPTGGVTDWMGDNFGGHGVNAVILDDDIHGQGYDNHQIHTMAGTGLRVILRDSNFTGKLHAGDGAGALAILTGLAGSGQGTFRLVTYGDDWEMAAGMGNWATDMPYAYGTYLWMINKCQAEAAWLHTWKLDAALDNPNFAGNPSMNVTYGTYGSIGGTAGYGGSNNAWYSDWAGYVPYITGGNGSGGCDPSRGGNCANFGTMWNTAQASLSSAAVNNINEAGLLMTNLHEEAWHDYLGGPISGWEKNYSAHVKNANVYAEASRWAAGMYANPTGAYFSDIDHDGFQELVMYNDRVMAVFEGNGGRAPWVFARGPGSQNFSVVGVDNAYWYGTEGDYNDGNHVAAFSDVGPNYQNDTYNMRVDTATGTTVQVTLDHYGVTKTFRLTLGQPYIDAVYNVGSTTQYLQAGWTPDLVDLVWNARMDRVWPGSSAYMGQRNPNTGATGAFVLGSGGAAHQKEISGRIMKGDEIRGTQSFEFYLFAGVTSAPDLSGHIAELDSLAAHLTDQIPPQVSSATYYPASRQLSITFNETVKRTPVVFTGIAVDANNDGTAEVTLDNSTVVANAVDAPTLALTVSPAVGTAIAGLSHTNLRLLLATGEVQDAAGNSVLQVLHTDNKMISYGPPTSITVDGWVNLAEWTQCAVAVRDSNDSQWTSSNEIQSLLVGMDSTYLYLGLAGTVSHNSWLIYVDTDPNGANGQADLRNIDVWNRKTQFTAPGFKADWQYGCYQDQGAFDANNFWKIVSATHAVDSSSAVLMGFDSQHVYGSGGGSELAIPWNVLYGLGAGRVPANAKISISAALAWNGTGEQLGGDVAPSNISAALPVIDRGYTFTVDATGSGYPTLPDRVAPTLGSASASNDSTVLVSFSERLDPATAQASSNYSIYRTSDPQQTLTVKSAVLQPSGSAVELTTSRQSWLDYTLRVSAVRDTACNPNTIVANSTLAFTGAPVEVGGEPAQTRLALLQNTPNPFGAGTRIRFVVPAGAAGQDLELSVYDTQGRLVRTLARGPARVGAQSLAWDGSDAGGARAGSGVYFYRLTLGGERLIRKMVLSR
ncbi:MAG: T9SS type A sorting domain-containing protein [Candidatus Eisenbacteria bacterium]|nr:T9SS type A sorting domain-containing protein [Candidatus Eisenbacteria bacterium]